MEEHLRAWSKRISKGGQIAVPVELMRALNVKTGDFVYLVLAADKASLIAAHKAGPVIEEALGQAGLIDKPTRRKRPKPRA